MARLWLAVKRRIVDASSCIFLTLDFLLYLMDNLGMDAVADQILQLVKYLMRLKGFRGRLVLALDLDADTGSVKLKTHILPDLIQ